MITVEVRGRYEGPDGMPASGAVTFRLSEPLAEADGSVKVATIPVRVELDATGSLTVRLLATDSEGLAPPMRPPVTYAVQVAIHGVPRRPAFALAVPASAAASGIDLAGVES
ncbi:MAG: hypothetical protein ACR2K2_14815 [Mycobacteriales bacterium]